MGVFIKYGETIEGGAVDFIARAWYKNGPVEHPVTKTVMCRYTTDRNSLGTIKKSYPIPTDEEIKDATQHYHREVGDQLKADALEIFTEGFKPVKPTVKEGISGRHGAQLARTSVHTIASIKTPLKIYDNLLGHTAKKEIKG